MKTKLTVSIDRDLVPRAKRSARRRGVSLSSVIERALIRFAEEDSPSFSGKWRGRFRVRDEADTDPRARKLAGKYLGEARP
jgi:hypothetical protein